MITRSSSENRQCSLAGTSLIIFFVLQNYILKSSASRCPAPSLGFAGIVPPNSGNDFNKERKRHCKRERHSACHHAPSSPDDSDDAQFPWGPQCPVMMGKKEIKKWAKCMKKTAHMHKRAAQQACSSATAAAGVGATQTETGQPRREGENVSQASPAFDFSAAASQIQEFLNAVGKLPTNAIEWKWNMKLILLVQTTNLIFNSFRCPNRCCGTLRRVG